MAWVRTIPPERAEGSLRREYEAAIRRAGRVYQILQVQSLLPAMLQRGMQMYLQIMHGDGPLSRAHREMIAVVTSVANDCHY
jgi:alkylhydroperoxidase family enzyme